MSCLQTGVFTLADQTLCQLKVGGAMLGVITKLCGPIRMITRYSKLSCPTKCIKSNMKVREISIKHSLYTPVSGPWLCKGLQAKSDCQTFKGSSVIKHISDLLVCYEAYRPLRSSGPGLLSVPGIKTKQGEATFSYYAAETVKSELKTLLYTVAFQL